MTDPFALIEATWPAARVLPLQGWTLREGQGGGGRVSAASWDGDGAFDIGVAEAGMADLGQTPLFMLRPGDDALDRALEARGYVIKDPVTILRIDAAEIAAAPPPVTCFSIWPPLAIQEDLWAEAGIGPGRLAVMSRAPTPKTALFGRIADRPAGAAFVAARGPAAMLHALEVLSPFRRQGLGRIMMQTAAHWAVSNGAEAFFLLVTQANRPANALYSSMGFKPVGHYHYRTRPEAT